MNVTLNNILLIMSYSRWDTELNHVCFINYFHKHHIVWFLPHCWQFSQSVSQRVLTEHLLFTWWHARSETFTDKQNMISWSLGSSWKNVQQRNNYRHLNDIKLARCCKKEERTQQTKEIKLNHISLFPQGNITKKVLIQSSNLSIHI